MGINKNEKEWTRMNENEWELEWMTINEYENEWELEWMRMRMNENEY